jgi:hypothetical protein
MHIGKYAVIHVDEVIDFFDDVQSAYSEAYRLDEYMELDGLVYIVSVLDVLHKLEK